MRISRIGLAAVCAVLGLANATNAFADNTSDGSIGVVQVGPTSVNPTVSLPAPVAGTISVPVSIGGTGNNATSNSTGAVQVGGGNTATGSTGVAQVSGVSASPSAHVGAVSHTAGASGSVSVGGGGANTANGSIGTVQVGGGNTASKSTGAVQGGAVALGAATAVDGTAASIPVTNVGVALTAPLGALGLARVVGAVTAPAGATIASPVAGATPSGVAADRQGLTNAPETASGMFGTAPRGALQALDRVGGGMLPFTGLPLLAALAAAIALLTSGVGGRLAVRSQR